MKVLIVEDDREILDNIKKQMILQLDCKQVDTCQSISKAKLLLDKNIYDLISLDITLPDGDGLKLAKEIRESSNNRHAYLFIITGNPSLEIAFKAYDQTRCFKFLHKPFNYSQLNSALKEFKEKIKSSSITNFFTYQNRTLMIKIPTTEILYFEIFYKECHIKTISDIITVSRYPLKDVLEATEKNNFIQIHRSYVVNLDFITGIELIDKKWFCLLKNSDERLLIGSKYIAHLKDRLQE